MTKAGLEIIDLWRKHKSVDMVLMHSQYSKSTVMRHLRKGGCITSRVVYRGRRDTVAESEEKEASYGRIVIKKWNEVFCNERR